MVEPLTKHCLPCEGMSNPLSEPEIQLAHKTCPLWQVSSDQKKISREFKFKNFYQTMAFVNAIAWMAHQENHHPDLSVSYNNCIVSYTTHAIKGLSQNDFICAEKVDSLYEERRT